MFVVVGYSAACLLLPCIVLCESLSKKLVILFSDVLSAVGNVILYPFAIHILGDENSVVVFDYPLVYPKGNGERDIVNIPLHIFLKKFEMFCIGINPHGA